MKKNFLLWSLLVVAVAAMCSCSSKSDDLLSRIPADSDIVAVGDVETIMKSAGVTVKDSKLKMPAWFSEMTRGEADDAVSEINDFVKKSGVNTEACAMTFDLRKEVAIILAKLDDEKKFVKYIEENNFDEEDKEDGITLYKEGGSYRSSYIAIYKGYAYVMPNYYGEKSGMRVLAGFIEDAKEKSFDKSKMADYIKDGVAGVSYRFPREYREVMKSAGVPSELMDIYNGYVCMKGSLDSDDIKIEIKIFDEEGKPIDAKRFAKYGDFGAKVNSKALAYMGKDESFVAAGSMKNVKWGEYLDAIAEGARLSRSDRSQLSMIEDYLKNIDGTIAFGFGFTNGLESIYALNYGGRNVLENVSFTAVVETKDGKAAKLMKDLGDLMDQVRVPYDGTASNGYSMELEGSTIYLSAEDNFIVLANHKIQKSKDNATVKAFDLDDYIASAACFLGKDNKIMKDLGLKNDVLLSYAVEGKDMEVEIELTIKNGKGAGVIEKIGNMILQASKTDFSAYVPSRSYDSYDYNSYDAYDWDEPATEVAEEVYYEEW